MSFLKRQLSPIPIPTQSFKHQTIIVTGSNVGLGLEAARHFVRLDASRLILAVRTLKKGEAAKADIEASTGRTGVIEVWELDMSDFKSVQAFAKRCGSLPRLDVVCENAGVAMYNYTETAGMETSIAVNVVGTFLLALNLLPILRKSSMSTGHVPRLAVTSSEVHAWAKFEEQKETKIFDALKKNKKAYVEDRYQVSKLLEVLFVRSLAAAMQSGPHANQPVVLNTLNPGLCHSDLSRDMTGFRSWFFAGLKAALARTTEAGSRTIVAAAAAGDESHGQYMSEAMVTEPSDFVRSEEGKKTQERVYSELLQILEDIQPGNSKNI